MSLSSPSCYCLAILKRTEEELQVTSETGNRRKGVSASPLLAAGLGAAGRGGRSYRYNTRYTSGELYRHHVIHTAWLDHAKNTNQ